jgi:hypothetical protein
MPEGVREQLPGRWGADVLREASVSADRGYHTNENVRWLADEGIDGYLADNRMRKRDPRFADAADHDPGKPMWGADKIPKKPKLYAPGEFRRAMRRGVIVHSDRGSQYCAHRFQRLLSKHRLLCSMSKRGDCFDNACAESFFHSLKVELTHGERYRTQEHARQAVFEYIETNYNPIRRHSALGHISPAAFEVQNVA